MNRRDPRMSHPGHDPSDPPPKRVLGVEVPQMPSPNSPDRWTPRNIAYAIAIVIGAVGAGGYAGYVGRPASATSNEVAELQTELKSAKEALSQSEISDLRKDMKAVLEQVAAQTKQNEATMAVNVRQDDQIVFLAEFAARLNGGTPVTGFPEPSERLWFTPNNPPPIHRTDRRWKSEP